MPYFAIGPGPTRVAADAISIPADRSFPPKGQFLLTSVSLRDVTVFEALRGWLDADVDVVKVREVIGTEPTPEARREFDAHQQTGMKFSHDVAVDVAFQQLGIAPFDIKIDTGKLGGESGGLAMTLGLLDVLTSGELTGGHKVAVTGTILIDGTVGDVDGVAQKTAAARAAGAEYLLVAPRNYETARAHAGPKLKVVKAGNLNEALAALHAIGGELGEPRQQGTGA